MGDESELLAVGQRNTEKHRDYLLKQTEPIRIDPDTQISVEHIGEMVCKLLNRTSELEISKKTYTKMLDYDTIDDTLYLRNPMQEDYMIVTKQGAHKKVSRIFIDEKIPRDERERMLVLAAGHHVIWIPGIRISESVKITQGTERILYLDFIGMQ
jgi:tRNA(Ile)-lysidine synthase